MSHQTNTVAVWRHPKPRDVKGRCIGHTDVVVDRRKLKRLAHRVRAWARQNGAPRLVVTSTLQRAAGVGRVLATWGWQHRVDARLNEMNFGRWDGQTWDTIGADAVDAWCQDFAAHHPGGGESLEALMLRCAAFLAPKQAALPDATPRCVVGHAGWINAALWLRSTPHALPTASTWPVPVGYGCRVLLQGPNSL